MEKAKSVLVYGLSTEGYMIASSLVSKSISTVLLDEKLHVATEINKQILSNYSSAQELIDAESLLSIKPEKNAISENLIIFFTPKIRETDDYKKQIFSTLDELSKNISKDTMIFNCVPVGHGTNFEMIEIIERSSGLSSETDFSYSYLPLNPQTTKAISFGINNPDNKKIAQTYAKNANITYDNVFDIDLSELLHLQKISLLYSPIISEAESLKKINNYANRMLLQNPIHYVDDISNQLTDVRSFSTTLESGDPSLYIISGILRGIESYIRFFIDQLKLFMKENSLKASRTEIYLCWSIDKSEIRGDKSYIHNRMIDKISDIVGNVNDINDYKITKNNKTTFYLPATEKKQLLILGSLNDEKILKTLKGKLKDNIFLIHANTICTR